MRILLLILTAFLAPGCTELLARLDTRAKSDLNATCETGAAGCLFINSPVAVDRSNALRIPTRNLLFYPTLERLEFVDGTGRNWVAHRGIVTDGASIPKLFVSIVGRPTSPEFVNAAAVHDAYCGIGNEEGPNFHADSWRNVHVMFYDALRVGGVPEIKAKVMFAAVWLGGPRWGEVQFDPADQPEFPMRRAMRRVEAFVHASNPPIPVLIEYIIGQEQGVAAAAAQAAGVGNGGGAGNQGDPSSPNGT